MKKKNESLFKLIGQARNMLMNRSKSEQDLIYFVSKLDNEERAAIILAYETLHPNFSYPEE